MLIYYSYANLVQTERKKKENADYFAFPVPMTPFSGLCKG